MWRRWPDTQQRAARPVSPRAPPPPSPHATRTACWAGGPTAHSPPYLLWCVHARTHTHTLTHKHNTHTRTRRWSFNNCYLSVFLCMCVGVYLCVYVCVCVCVQAGQRQLSASESQLAELGLMSCCLPEHILEDILAERLQVTHTQEHTHRNTHTHTLEHTQTQEHTHWHSHRHKHTGKDTHRHHTTPQNILSPELCCPGDQLSDCHRGVVIDGLETAYGRSLSSTLLVVLKAFNNRQHIYLVDLHNSYPAFRARERAQRDAEGNTHTLTHTHTHKPRSRQLWYCLTSRQ